MGLFERMVPARRASAGVPSYGMIPPLGSVQSSSGLLVSQATSMGVSTVFACVNRLATDLARCAPSLYRLQDDGSEEPITDDHPLLDIFDRPNEQQTWFEWAFQMWVGYLLRMNAYAAIKRSKGDPYALIPINPDAVMVLEAGDGNIFYNVNRIGLWQIAMLREFPVAMAEEDILHLRGLTFNSLVGVSTIGLGRDAIGLAMGLEQQASRWMANGAQPGTWLKSPNKLSDVVVTRLANQFDNKHASIHNTGKTVVLEEGIEPVKMTLSSVDLEFMAQRNLQVLEICRFFGVPPHKVFVVDRGTVQNIVQQDQDYVNTAIMQRLVMIEQKFAQVFDLAKEDILVKFDESHLLRGDATTRVNNSRLRIISGITTPNEERKGWKLPPIEGADNLLVPANTAALGSEATGIAPDAAGAPGKGKIADPGVETGGKQPNAEDVAESTSDQPGEN